MTGIRGSLCADCHVNAECLPKRKNLALCRRKETRRTRIHMSLIMYDLTAKMWFMLIALICVNIAQAVAIIIMIGGAGE